MSFRHKFYRRVDVEGDDGPVMATVMYMYNNIFSFSDIEI